ncbi:MAG: pilus assembly protein TadG-related protein [Candidatus Eiseniibacteriota bacterium]
MRQSWKHDKGNVLIMVALSFAVLAAFGMLTIDVGRILVTRTQLQNAADAAALAGASVYCENAAAPAEDVRTRARQVGGANNALQAAAVPVDMGRAIITLSGGDPDAGMNDNTVTVTTFSNTSQYFYNMVDLLGPRIRDALVTATGTARCGATCNVTCVKPWSIPDRWDDNATIAGYPAWRNNGYYDFEDYTDVNGNMNYDIGEPYTDGNGNGTFDSEPYHPLLTGYVPDPVAGNTLAGPDGDIGLLLTLKANNDSKPQPGQYWAVDLPPINRGDPIPGANQYRWNIANCNESPIAPGDILATEPGNMVGPTRQGMLDLIAKDPNAEWDPTTLSVINSDYAISPRIVLIPIHDPRFPIHSGRPSTLKVAKVAAFFMERMNGNEVVGRFLKVRGKGDPCPPGQNVGNFTFDLSLIPNP